MRLTQPLAAATRRRVELQLWLIPVYVWLAFAWIAYAIDLSPPGRLDRSGHIKGHDFVGFYVMGEIVNDGRTNELYSVDDHARRLDRLVPEYEHRFVPVNVPQLALLFAPLARLPYVAAAAVWLTLSAMLYATCCYAVWTALPSLRQFGWQAAFLAAAFPPFYSLIAYGHISALALVLCTAALFAFRADREFLGGILLGSIFIKPQLGVALPVVFLYGRNWKILAGATVAVLMQLAIAAAAFGPDTLWTYARVVTNLGDVAPLLEPSLYQMHSLRSFSMILLPWPAIATLCYVVASTLVLWKAATFWKSKAPIELRYSVLLFAMVLVDPHVNVYDLVVLVPALTIAVSTALDAGSTWGRQVLLLLYALYFLPALPAIAEATRLQLSVPVLAIIMWRLTELNVWRSLATRAA